MRQSGSNFNSKIIEFIAKRPTAVSQYGKLSNCHPNYSLISLFSTSKHIPLHCAFLAF